MQVRQLWYWSRLFIYILSHENNLPVKTQLHLLFVEKRGD